MTDILLTEKDAIPCIFFNSMAALINNAKLKLTKSQANANQHPDDI